MGSLPDAPTPQAAAGNADDITLHDTPRHLLHDQAAIWTSPVRIRIHDLVWLVPLAGAEAAAIATDHHTMTSVVSRDPGFNQDNVNVSNAMIGSYLAVPVALFGYGQLEQHAHARAAGILSGEAILDGVVVEQGLKLVFWRERPYNDSGHGNFFQGSAGIDSSFPSSHAVLAWATAAELAGEYPKPWIQASLYTAATSISLTRVLGQQHFPGDVLAGSAAGWLVGHCVFRAHHRHHHDLSTK
ncbi:MAG: phosphatase PAP2 family protein [Acidobacteriota bacterium]